MSTIRIDTLGPAEWERGRTIRLEALAESPDAFGSTLQAERVFGPERWKERLARPATVTFVAVDGDEAGVGLAVGAPYDESAGLYSMWVRPGARGRGVGGALVDAVIAWARAGGHERILLDVGDHNPPAIALYASRGFRPTGVRGALPPPREHITEHQMALVL